MSERCPNGLCTSMAGSCSAAALHSRLATTSNGHSCCRPTALCQASLWLSSAELSSTPRPMRISPGTSSGPASCTPGSRARRPSESSRRAAPCAKITTAAYPAGFHQRAAPCDESRWSPDPTSGPTNGCGSPSPEKSSSATYPSHPENSGTRRRFQNCARFKLAFSSRLTWMTARRPDRSPRRNSVTAGHAVGTGASSTRDDDSLSDDAIGVVLVLGKAGVPDGLTGATGRRPLGNTAGRVATGLLSGRRDRRSRCRSRDPCCRAGRPGEVPQASQVIAS